MKPESVLIVEDNADIQDLLKTFFELEGIQVLQAFDGKQALEILKNEGRNPALILLDLMMPVMDGRDLVRAIEADPCLSPLTARTYIISASKDEAPKSIAGFLTKPFEVSTLMEAYRTSLKSC